MGMIDDENPANLEKVKERGDKPMIPALIAAGGSLLSGLFGQAAEKKKQEREAAAKMQESATQNEIGANQAMSQGQGKAFGSLMDAWKSALLK